MKRSLLGVVLMLAIGVGRSVAQTVTTGGPSEEAAIRYHPDFHPDPDCHGYLGRDSWMRRKARFAGVSSAFAWTSSYTENQ